jgi:hypothetical protein
MSDKLRPGGQTKNDRSDEVAPKRVGFLFDSNKSNLDDMVDAVHRAWEESNHSPGPKRQRDPSRPPR